MNFRITTLLFAVLLSTLWVFGLMLAYKKSAGDPGFIMPTLRAADPKIDHVIIETIGDKDAKPITMEFKLEGETWLHVVDKQKAKVEGNRIKQSIVDAITSAKADDSADTSKSKKTYGMDPPQMTIKLTGDVKGERKTWEFYVGKESVDRAFVYVNSSDRKDKVFAVSGIGMKGLLVKDPRYLRSKRLFDFDSDRVTEVHTKKAKDELKVKKDDELWKFIIPPLGPVGAFDTESEEKKKDFVPKEPGIASVKSLLTTIGNIRVEEDDDFEALGKPAELYGLAENKESMRIDVLTGDKKETLLIGKEVPKEFLRDRKGDFYYAKYPGDDGIMQISARWLEPVDKVLKEPGKLRSLDIAAFDASNADYIIVKQGKDEFKFYKTTKSEPRPFNPHEKFAPPPAEFEWHLFVGKDKQKANTQAVQKLLNDVLGKKRIEEFTDFAEADLKKRETEMGLESPAAEITVYLNAVEKKKEGDKDEKKEEKKNDKTKTEVGKDDPPKLNEKLKAVITLAIGKTDKETVHARRVIEDGKAKSWFTLKKEFVEKMLPAEGVQLAFADLALPTYAADDVIAVVLERTTDRGPEKFEFTRTTFQNRHFWHVKDGAGSVLANSENVSEIVNELSRGAAKKLIKKLDDKENLDKYGLTKPGVVVTVTTKKRELAPGAAARLVTMLGLGFISGLEVVADAVAQVHAEKGESFTLELGKDTSEEKDRPGTFAKHSGSKMLMLVPADLVTHIKKVDLRDRATVMYNQPQLEALYKASVAFNPHGILMFASPHFTGAVHNFDVDTIKEVRIESRTPAEFRSYQFVRDAKDKEKDKDKPWAWTDKSSLKEFQLDSEKVNQFVKDFAKLKTAERFAVYVLPKDAKAAQESLDTFKLGPKDFTAKLELVTEDGKTITLTIGMNQMPFGFYAHSSAWSETVFFVAPSSVAPLLSGPGQFAKERFAGN